MNVSKALRDSVQVFFALSLFGCAGLNAQQESEFSKLFDPNETYEYFRNAETYSFQSHENTLSKINVAWLADASMLAYCNEDFAKKELKRAGLEATFFQQEDGKGTQGFVASDKEKIIVMFRGTEIQELQDVLYDANFLPTAEGSGRVHKGFRDALDAVWEKVKELIHHAPASSGNERSVWFTGHSLGGAIASLAAGRWKANPTHSQQIVSLYTFGAPGVGNKDYVTNYPDVSVVRVVDNEDQVAKTENQGLVFDLRHPGGVTIKFKRPSKMLTETKHDKLPDWLADHAPIYYAENSWKQVSQK